MITGTLAAAAATLVAPDAFAKGRGNVPGYSSRFWPAIPLTWSSDFVQNTPQCMGKPKGPLTMVHKRGN